MTTDSYILEVENLQTHFHTGSGTARAVDGVSFGIRPGETYALVGESGCGKSVTALSILQLVPKPAGFLAGGRILYRGQEISKLSPVEMRAIRGNEISMIFQEPMTALNPVFTIGAQITEALTLHQGLDGDAASNRAIDALDHVGIPDPAARYGNYPHQLSGGMRQRVMIAMALACRPDVLIADEPTTALDVTIQAQILDLIGQLQKEMGTAVLLITHDMGVVRQNADRVGVMYAGRIVEEAPRDELFANPQHPYTQLLLRSLPARSERNQPLTTIEGLVPKATDFPEGCRFNNRCPAAMERCRTDTPGPHAAGEGHSACCFLLETQPGYDAAEGLVSAKPPPSSLDANIVRLVVNDLKMHFPIRKGVLRRTVGHVKAVDGVSLDIRKGETVALVGESGCGKTTVGRCIVRLLDPSHGSIALDGEPLQNLSRTQLQPFRRRVQMIFQDPNSCLNPRLMIRDIITEGMQRHGIGKTARERVELAKQIMQKVGLDPSMVTRYPHEFSGGQRQRIGLARALAVKPDLLVCDEATSSLDVSVQAQILNLMKQIQSDLGLSYLFITHDLSVVKYLADRVFVMYLGRIVESGTTGQIFDAPAHPYTRALLSAVPRLDPETGHKRIVLEGDVPSPINPPAGCHFHPRCPHATDACAQTTPPLDLNEDGRQIACIRKDEI